LLHIAYSNFSTDLCNVGGIKSVNESVICASVFVIDILAFELAMPKVLCRHFKEFYRNFHKLLIIVYLWPSVVAVTVGLMHILCGYLMPFLCIHAASAVVKPFSFLAAYCMR